MDLYLLIFVVSVSLFLGSLVVKSGLKKSSSVYISLMIFTLIAWMVISYLEDETVSLETARILVNIDYALASLLVGFFLIFCLSFLNRKAILSSTRKYIILSVSFIFSVLSFGNLFILDIEKNTNGSLSFIEGDYIYLYILYIFIFVSWGIYALIRKYLALRGTKKIQLSLVLFGLSLSAVSIIVTNLILPRIIETGTSITRVGIYSVLFFIGFTSYAIVKHRLMDIRMVVARSVAFLFLLVSVAAFAGIIMMLLPTYLFSPEFLDKYNIPIRSSLGIVLVFIFQPLRRWITKVTDKVFFKEAYEIPGLLKKVADNAHSSLILSELLYKTIDILIREMRVSRGFFVLLDDDEKVHTVSSIKYKKVPEFDVRDVKGLAKHGIVLFDYLTENSHLKTILRKIDAVVAVGLMNGGKPVGVLFLGEKSSGDMYTQKDIDFLNILAPEMVVAIHRAEEHEKVQNFNVFLQKEVKRKTKELQEANTHLRELDKAKDEFISMASHQLRTPLTAIKGYLSMLMDGDAGKLKSDQSEFVKEGFDGANRMVALINDLLNVSRMDTGRFFLEPAKVDMEEMVRVEMKQLEKMAKDKGLDFAYKKKAKKIPIITADETKIRQVVMNFTDNALHYTSEGSVKVVLDADKEYLIFTVVDTGMGIPKDQQKGVFQKFFRAENARRSRPDGTGLGIYLAKRVVGDHGGELIFKSEEGKGSTFGFKLPLKSHIKKELTIPPPDLQVKEEGIGEGKK